MTDWRDKTIPLGELARLAREELVANPMGPFDEGVNTGIESVIRSVGTNSGLSDEEQGELRREAGG